MLVESYFLTVQGTWHSTGLAESSPAQFRHSLRDTNGSLVVTEIKIHGSLVEIYRAMAVGDVPLERSDCLFENDREAACFATTIQVAS